jgi:hypothetical protein
MSLLRRIFIMLGIGIAVSGPSGGIQPTNDGKQWDATPDTPTSFGYKVSWLAIRSQNMTSVITAMGLRDTHPANWATGISAAYEKSKAVFVTPALDGWTFVVGRDLPTLDQGDIQGDPLGAHAFGNLFARLIRQFPEVQFFGSYRVVDYVAWARARGGKVERAFSFADGTVYANVGKQSTEEHALGFLDTTGMTPEAAGQALFAAVDNRNKQQESLEKAGVPRKEALERVSRAGRYPLPDEQDVVDLAKAWSGIDPTQLEHGHFDKGSGTVGFL